MQKQNDLTATGFRCAHLTFLPLNYAEHEIPPGCHTKRSAINISSIPAAMLIEMSNEKHFVS